VIDSVPVTEDDLQAEARSAGLPADAIDAATRKTLLAQVIDRRLLVGAARAAEIERDPVLRAAVQRAGEMVTASVMAQRLVGRPAPASVAEARRYMAANPLRFAGRQILVVDAIEVGARGLPEGLLDNADSLKDVASTLDRVRLPFERRERRFDSATLPPEIARQMARFESGRLFRLPMGATVLMGVVTGRQSAAAPLPAQLAAARDAAIAAKQEAQLRTALAALRRKADVRMGETP
jgi:hypothetical protein